MKEKSNKVVIIKKSTRTISILCGIMILGFKLRVEMANLNKNMEMHNIN